MTFSEFLLPGVSILSAFVALCVTVGGLWVMRQSYAKSATEIQERIINALKQENDSLNRRIDELEQELAVLQSTIETITEAFKPKGIFISVTGEVVTITESHGSKTTTVRRKPRPTPTPKHEEP